MLREILNHLPYVPKLTLKIFSIIIINFPILLITNYNMSHIFIFKHVLSSSIILGLVFYKYNIVVYERIYFFFIMSMVIMYADLKKFYKKIKSKIKIKYNIFIFNYIKYRLRKTYLPMNLIYIIEKYLSKN